MTSALNPEGLWIKSRLFINRALDPQREFEEQAFWACSALELLAKAALATVSPLLVANPMDNGDSLLVASGLVEGNLTSVQAKTIWSRCKRAFRPFSESEAKLLSVGRNEYIHSANVGFDAIPPHAWWPRYWAQVAILVNHMGKVIEDYVARPHLRTVEDALAARSEAVKQQLEARISRAQTMLSQSLHGTLSPRQQKEWDAQPYRLGTYETAVECPACQGSATLYGDDVVDTEVGYAWEDEEPSVTLVIVPDILHCGQCRLELWGYDLLHEAGLDDGFEIEGSTDDIPYEPEYDNE